MTKRDKHFWRHHSLSISALGVMTLWLVLYIYADPKSRAGSFFGNAIADWTGVAVTILATKWFFEKGSTESRQPRPFYSRRLPEFMHEHSLTIFLVISGVAWVALYAHVDPESKWGTVVSNLVSEWSQHWTGPVNEATHRARFKGEPLDAASLASDRDAWKHAVDQMRRGICHSE